MLLKNLDLLDALLPGEHYRFLTAFRAFDAVVTACFGYDLDPFYMRYLNEFEKSWMDLQIPIFPKLHVLLEHLPEELTRTGA